MAQQRLTDRTELASSPADGDLVHIVDVSDTTDNPNGTSKKLTVANLLANVQQTTGNKFVGDITLVSGYTYSAYQQGSVINGVTYDTYVADSSIVLGAADGSNDRFDIIVFNSNSTFTVVAGTAAADPIIPTIDTDTQVIVRIIRVTAASSTESGVTNELVYDEDTGVTTEWNATTTANVNEASTEQAANGTKSIKFTSATTSDYVSLVDTSTHDGNLATQIKFKVYLPTSANYRFYVQVGNIIQVVQDGLYGFSSSTTASWQQIIIPASEFAGLSALSAYDTFVITNGRNNTTYFIDEIYIVEGFNTGSSEHPNYTLNLSGNNLQLLKDGDINSVANLSVLANTPTAKTGTSIVFTEDAEYYADGSYNYNTSGNITLSLTGAVEGTGVAVYVNGYTPTISGEDYIELSDTSNGTRDIYYFYYAYGGIKLNIIGEGVLTTPVVTLTPADTEIQVDWTSSVGATSYTVLRNTSNTTVGATTIYTGALLTYTDTGLTNGVTYYYFVQATGGTGKWDSAYGTNSDVPEAYPSTAFVINVKTDNAGASSSDQFTMPTYSSGSYNCTVDWGDGNTNNITTYNDAAWTHTYSSAGTYRIVITGVAFTGMYFNNGGDRLKLLSIEQWGIFKFSSNIRSFYGCSNMDITATDAPAAAGTTVQEAFYDCTSLTSIGNVSGWGTASVTQFSAFLRGCTSFNQDLSDLDTSAATSIANLLYGCTSFNNGLPTANMPNLTNISSMLLGCTSFNSTLANLDLSSCPVGLNATAFLDGATSFNHVSIETLDVSKIDQFGFMLRSSGVDRSLAAWDVRECVTGQAVGFLDNRALSQANYDATLIGWDTRTGYNSVAWDFNTSPYTAAGAGGTARASLITKGLTFTDVAN